MQIVAKIDSCLFCAIAFNIIWCVSRTFLHFHIGAIIFAIVFMIMIVMDARIVTFILTHFKSLLRKMMIAIGIIAIIFAILGVMNRFRSYDELEFDTLPSYSMLTYSENRELCELAREWGERDFGNAR
jgi:hypothetical protein